jgi:hypothetical protein
VTRQPLPNWRRSETHVVQHGNHEFLVGFGFGEDGRVMEVFCSSGKTGVDMTALVTDACILVSLLLQHGESVTALAESMGENRAEGENSGPPASLIGAIVRVAAWVDAQRTVLELMPEPPPNS